MGLMTLSTTSTGNPGDSSDGALNLACMRQWTLALSQQEIETGSGYPILRLNWSREGSDGALHHMFSYKFAETCDATSTAVVYRRLFAHLALDALPDAALGEILENLGNAWAFYRPPVPQSSEPLKTRKGKVSRRYERPTYTIED